MTYQNKAKQTGPKLIANAGIFAEGDVLLVKYTNMPDHQKGWFIPHANITQGTHPDDAIKSGLKAQLNLDVTRLILSHAESFIGNDGAWHLPLNYKIDLDQKPALSPNKEVAEYKWFSVTSLPDREDVAHHGWAIDNIEGMAAR